MNIKTIILRIHADKDMFQEDLNLWKARVAMTTKAIEARKNALEYIDKHLAEFRGNISYVKVCRQFKIADYWQENKRK